MHKLCAIAVIAGGAMVSSVSARPLGTVFIGSTWGNPSNSVIYMDNNLNMLGSFPTKGQNPNGVAVGGGLIFTGNFPNAEVEAYDYGGNFQFAWPSTFGIQGLEYVKGNIAVADASSGNVIFYNALSGAQQYQIPMAQGSTIEGLAYDGKNLFELGDATIDACDPLTGSVNYQLNNPAFNDPFSGTALSWGGGVLTIGSANGNWYKIDSSNGGLLGSGNNGHDMYGLGQIPAPGALGLLGVAGIAAARPRR